MVRARLLALLIAGAAGTAIACGGPRAAPAPGPAPVTVTIPPTPTAASPAPAPAPASPSSEDAPAPSSAPPVAAAGYAAQLDKFFRQRWQLPASISVAEAKQLCVTFQANVSRDLVIWHVRGTPTKSSGNALFDDSARAMLEKLMQDRTHLPDPPPELAEMFRGRAIRVSLLGDPTSDASICKEP